MIPSAGELANELSAWDALSDEALETVDGMTEERAEYYTNSNWPDAILKVLEIETSLLERVQQLEDAVKSLSRRFAELERQARTGLADAGQRLGRLEHVVNELECLFEPVSGVDQNKTVSAVLRRLHKIIGQDDESSTPDL